MRYRVRTPFVAVRPAGDGHFRFVTLYSGSVVTIAGDVQRSGLVDIMHEDHVLAAFMRDIQERAERVEKVSS